MFTVDLKAVEAMKAEMGSDLGKVAKELKRLQSVKCRLKKEKDRADYQQAMEAVLNREQVLKEVRAILDPKEKKVPDFTQADVDMLDYEQTMKAIKSIQSKKCLSLQDESEHGKAELKKAERVEAMLQERKKLVTPADETAVKKTELQAVIDNLASLKSSKARDLAMEMLQKLM